MLTVDSIQLLLTQVAIAFVACLIFLFIGECLRAFFNYDNEKDHHGYKKTFYSLLAGMLFVVTVYAIAITGFKTIQTLIVLTAIVCFWKRIKLKPRFVFPKINWYAVSELLILVVVFTLILNFLPESENKQRDSFYYLKISEALNLTGQENANQYYNLLSNDYHGLEAYHYFESWLSGLLSRFTQSLIPNIQNFRIVTFTIISLAFCYGLFYTYELVAKVKPGLLQKIYCLGFVFFTPDVFYYLPESIRYYLVYNFESNFLERPNFRLIYLFLIPVIIELLKNRLDGRFVFFLACFCLINPTVITMVIPAFLILLLYQFFILKDAHRWIVKKYDLLIFAGFLIVYIAFYKLFSVSGIPAVYETETKEIIDFYRKSWRFVILTIATGLLYVSIIVTIAWIICYKFIPEATAEFIKRNKPLLIVMGLLIVSGTVLGRLFIYIENFVQVSYTSYIIVSVLIFLLFVPFVAKSWKFTMFSITVFLAGYFTHKIYAEKTKSLIFHQNHRYSYSGKPYSKKYIDDVIAYAISEKNIMGAYIADSAYYRDLYYSLRNPNVYHLPITYILSNHVRVNDFCLSDPIAIKYDVKGKFKDNKYLNNAISRSYYHRINSSYSISDQQIVLQIKDFIVKNNLQYLILTSGITIDSIPGLKLSHKFYDSNTKERFWVIDGKNVE